MIEIGIYELAMDFMIENMTMGHFGTDMGMTGRGETAPRIVLSLDVSFFQYPVRKRSLTSKS